ncbi:MAG: hypothetical protein IJB74_08890 [Clostridia bacterium]|nr:hypothetical protein [Clostridia bacterium]
MARDENSHITFADCEKIIKEMPRMRDGREMYFNCYPESHPERDELIQEAIEEEICLLDNTMFRYLSDDRYPLEFRIALAEKAMEFFNFVYDDGNYGRIWRVMLYNHGYLGLRYFEQGDTKNALKNFRKMSKLAAKFDSLERISVMYSVMFEGKEFDKHTLGSTYIAKMQVKELLTEKYPLTDEFKSTTEFEEILSMLE